VILTPRGGDASPSWGVVQPKIAQSTRVCACDRAGMGWSEGGPRPRDMNQQVAELHALLTGAGIDPPYVLVGHSSGGRIARLCQGVSVRDSGMVLIVPGHWMTIPVFHRRDKLNSPPKNARVVWLAGSRHLVS
jgi:pimeloyl-ACP methyl ester carboxylesterase